MKKGEGLTNRFKVNPDHFNLKNIPKYKFANKRNNGTETVEEKTDVIIGRPCRMSKSGTTSARKICLDAPKQQTICRSKSSSAVQKKKSAWTEEFQKEESLKHFNGSSSMTKSNHYRDEIDDLISLNGVESCNASADVQDLSDYEDHKPYNHVQFTSHVEVNSEAEIEPDNFDKFSTPNSKSFAHFKEQLLAGLSTRSEETLKDDFHHDHHEEDQPAVMSLRQDLDDMKKHLKDRLLELENEIKMFQKENANVVKMKQQLELVRMKMEQEREELEEKLNDERVKMEVYFHDERMKIKEKHETLDRRMKEIHKPTRKERDEVMRLNEKISHLEAELKAKEVKHGAASARLRTQIRQLEKQTAEQKLEIDVLKRENKRLDAENIRLRRENNSKMLNDINKNIAKLASNTDQINGNNGMTNKKEVLNRSKSAVVAKVVSHAPPSSKRKTKTPEPKAIESDEIDSDIENDNLIGNDSNYYARPSGGKHLVPPHSMTTPGKSLIQNETLNRSQSDRKETINPDGSKDIWYPNGNIKKISADGMVIRMMYFNKDIKETNVSDGTIKYYFAENNTWQTTFSDGKQILEFPK